MKKQISTNAKLMSLLLIATGLVTFQNANAQSWNLLGNAGTNASTNFLGTTDNVPLKIRTNNLLRVNITNTGKVGIGNFSPVYKLDVKGGSINTDSLYRISGVQALSRDGSGNIQVGDATAFVGIGTSTPSQKLQVSGTIYSTSGGFKFPDGTVQTTAASGANTQLSNLGSTAVNSNILPNTTGAVSLGTATKRWGNVYGSYADFKNSTTLAANFDGGTQTSIRWQENGVSRGYIGSMSGNAADVDFGTSSGNTFGNVHLTLQGTMKEFTLTSYGEIGIGTTTPQGKLHIFHDSGINDPHLNLYENAADFARINFGNTTTANFWTIAAMPSFLNDDARFNFYNSVAGNVMTLTGNGSVCIGTGTPATGYKLSVNGKIICEEMKVQLNTAWPDYVFGNSYKLQSLKEVEIFTAQQGHLPGIPSAADVKIAGGVEVGKMQTLLLQKIEELTLHLIIQEKKINILETRLNETSNNNK